MPIFRGFGVPIALLYNRNPAKPYGLRSIQVMRQIVMGPFRTEVHDYEQIELPDRAASEATRA
jgi:hypothetical protein